MAFFNEKDWREMFRLRRAIVRAEQSLSEIDREILPDGLCESDLAILERLARKGARPVNGLARQVGLTSGSMTSAVNLAGHMRSLSPHQLGSTRLLISILLAQPLPSISSMS